MAIVTQPLRDEHKDLWPHVELLRTTADSVGEVPLEMLQSAVDEAYDFLARHLIPHAQAEDRALYPVVQNVMGAPEATATMRRDHVEIGRLTAELSGLGRQLASTASITTSQAKALRRILYSLYALVKVHFAKEEEVYLPLLDARLTPVQAQRMFEAMEEAAREAKSALPA